MSKKVKDKLFVLFALLWQHLLKQKNMETKKDLEILCRNSNESFSNAVHATIVAVVLWICLATGLLFLGNDYSWGEPVSPIKVIGMVIAFILCFLVVFSFWKTAKKHKRIYEEEKSAL